MKRFTLHGTGAMTPTNKAVFLDRDGTVVVDKGYLNNVEGIELMPQVTEALPAMKGMGYLLVLVTNQSGIGRGYLSENVVVAQHKRLQSLLRPHGAEFDLIMFCPHKPGDGCRCRKPRPGMLEDAAAAMQISCDASVMIGDKATDMSAGTAVGCRTILLGDGNAGDADFTAGDLTGAINVIRQHLFY